MDFYTIPIKNLPGIGGKRGQLYKKLGVETVFSLLYRFPRSYLDFTQTVPIAKTADNEYNVVRARVKSREKPRKIRANLTVYNATVYDESGEMQIIIFNNKYAFEALKADAEYIFYGKVEKNLIKNQMLSPQIEAVSDSSGGEKTGCNTGIIPCYNLTAGLTNKMVRTNVAAALKLLDTETPIETLNSRVLRENNLCSLSYALHNIHFPVDNAALEKARNRMGFEEMFGFQLALLKLGSRKGITTEYTPQDPDIKPFTDSLPFKLTEAQKTAIDDCIDDCLKGIPMLRLLQGDVGSGKTIVAAALGYIFAKSGFQTAVMAPTGILAAQHYKTFNQTLSGFGVRVGLLTGSCSRKQKQEIYDKLKHGEIDIIIGTHALLYAEDCFKNLAFIVTDEQHRFGVQQRAEIIGKGRNPHMLVMSATPIPRTMALFVYGNLDVSVIDEMPANRHPVETYVVTPDYRSRIYKFILKHISAKKQAYIVCPLIEKSENTPDTLSDAENYIKELKSGILRDARISLLHSRIPAAQKDEIMYAFADGEIDVLVSTTVVEVGVDVPNATLMIVENAERFGLSQLHQLRGRVGRGKDKSYCILISRNKNSERLKIMARCSDGFVIAKEDLKLRGIGDFFGNRQHGMPFFQLVSVYDDIEVIRETRRSAENILTGDPMLEKEENAPLKKLIKNLISEDAAGRLN